jgi:hypothetical protein
MRKYPQKYPLELISTMGSKDWKDCSGRRKTYIYGLVDPDDKVIKYVGKTKNPKQRYMLHLLDKEKSPKTDWIKNLKQKNKFPVFQIMKENG